MSALDKYEEALRTIRELPGSDGLVLQLLYSAAAEGDGRALYALGTWYLHGHKKLRKNRTKAMHFLKEAHRKGVPEAAHDLAYSYFIGHGVPKSKEKALELYAEAALRGDTEALKGFARMVADCQGYNSALDIAKVLFRLRRRLMKIKSINL